MKNCVWLIGLVSLACSSLAHEPQIVRAENSEAIPFPGHDTFLLSDHSSTQSQAAVLEILLPARTIGAPPHVHTREDEHFYVIEGAVQFLDRDRTITADAGSLVVLPRGHVHGFWNLTDKPARMLLIVTPGEFASFFDAVVAEIRLANPGDPQRVGAIIAEVAERYHVTVHPDKIPESAKPVLP